MALSVVSSIDADNVVALPDRPPTTIVECEERRRRAHARYNAARTDAERGRALLDLNRCRLWAAQIDPPKTVEII